MTKRKIEATEQTEETRETAVIERTTVRRTRTVRAEAGKALVRKRNTRKEVADLRPLPPMAAGWEPQHIATLTPHELREQRGEQVWRAMEFLAIRSFGDPFSSRITIQEAANILRAGPGASPLEAIHGRMV